MYFWAKNKMIKSLKCLPILTKRITTLDIMHCMCISDESVAEPVWVWGVRWTPGEFYRRITHSKTYWCWLLGGCCREKPKITHKVRIQFGINAGNGSREDVKTWIWPPLLQPKWFSGSKWVAPAWHPSHLSPATSSLQEHTPESGWHEPLTLPIRSHAHGWHLERWPTFQIK